MLDCRQGCLAPTARVAGYVDAWRYKGEALEGAAKTQQPLQAARRRWTTATRRGPPRRGRGHRPLEGGGVAEVDRVRCRRRGGQPGRSRASPR